MKNLIVLRSYDNSYTIAVNPDHIVGFYEDEEDKNNCIINFLKGEPLIAKISFYDLVDLINKSYE